MPKNATELEIAPYVSTPEVLPQPTVGERALFESPAKSRQPERVRVRTARDKAGRAIVGPVHNDADGHHAALSRTFASASADFVASEMDALGKVTNVAYAHVSARELNAGLAMVAAAEPRNELEAALAVNAVAAHQQAMRLLAKIENVDGAPYAAAAYGTAAAKLMRACADQLLALDRLRRKADQRIVVEHLHLEQGARAVFNQIGVAEGRGVHDGGGHDHATIQGRADGLAQVSATMRSEDPVGGALSQPCGTRTEKVPHARRGSR